MIPPKLERFTGENTTEVPRQFAHAGLFSPAKFIGVELTNELWPELWRELISRLHPSHIEIHHLHTSPTDAKPYTAHIILYDNFIVDIRYQPWYA